MALEKLQALHTFLVEQNLVDENQVASWMENGKPEACAKSLGNGIRVCRLSYDALVSIERFSGNEDLLLALICVWLMDVDPEREDDELPPPDIDIDILDNGTADVELRVAFIENIDLVEDANGLVPFKGKTWSVASVLVDEPNEAAVGDDQAQPTDKSYVREG